MSEPKLIHVVGAAILNGKRCLVAQRGPSVSLPNKWEFPGGKVRRGETPAAALKRELQEELGVEAEIGGWLGRGESITGSQRVVLDVYETRADVSQLRAREHAEVCWITESQIYSRDWAAADIPVLPALGARMRHAGGANTCRRVPVVISADWGKEAHKRAVYVGLKEGTYTIRREAPPSGGWTFQNLLTLAQRLGRQGNAPVLVGIDAALGVPTAFARALGVSRFRDSLAQLERSGGLAGESASASVWHRRRPFFRVPKGAGGLNRFFEAAGGRTEMLRQIELRTAAKTVFALSGIPGTVGSGSRALWRELTPLLRDTDPSFRLWPFDGDLRELTRANSIILAEVYPGASYRVALDRVLPAPIRRVAKTRQAVRARAIQELENAPWFAKIGISREDSKRAVVNDDYFDALMTAAALVRLLGESRPLSCDLVDPLCEGGILGTGGVLLREALPRPSRASHRAKQGIQRKTPRRRRTATGLRCPIPGCEMTFAKGHAGWDGHVGSLRKHPGWHPRVRDTQRRRELFREEFGAWFRGN